MTGLNRNRMITTALAGLLVLLLSIMPGSGTAEAQTADYSSLWTGAWVLQDDPDSMLVIGPGSEGRLHMEAVFNRVAIVEADIYALDEEVIIFNGDFQGSLVRGSDGSVTMTVGRGGVVKNDDVLCEFFLNNLFIFTKDGRPAQTETAEKNRWASRALISLENCADSFLPGEKLRTADDFEFSPDGRIRSWQHYEKTDFGSRQIIRDSGYIHLYEYDQSSRLLRYILYDDGVIQSMEENTYNADGTQASYHYAFYADDHVHHNLKHYEYDAAGRLLAVRYSDNRGREGIEEQYEYAADGSYTVRSLSVTAEDNGDDSNECRYDSHGNLLHMIQYRDGAVYADLKHEYELDGDGRILRDISTGVYNHDGITEQTSSVTEYTYSEAGFPVAKTERFDDHTDETVYMMNEAGTVVYQYQKTDYTAEDPYVYVRETEYDTGANGGTLCTRNYESARGEDREAQEIVFTVGTGDQGTRRGILPFPRAEGEASGSYTVESLLETTRYLTRGSLGRLFGLNPAGDAMYDSAAPILLGGYPGSLRFIYRGAVSNRMDGIWWVCRDRNVDAEEIISMLQDSGVEWDGGAAPGAWNMLGIRTKEGSMDRCRVVLTDASDGEDVLICVAFTFKWYEPESGLVMPWETGKYTPIGSDTVPAQQQAPEEDRPEPEPAPEPEQKPEPEPVQQQVPQYNPAEEALIPIAGRPGSMQVPVAQVNASSYIVGKDPTAYMPFRMTDGIETTAFQFSAKDSPLGNTYLYFDFEVPSALDQLWIKNGFWKKTDGKDQYGRNCRVKRMTVEFRYAGGAGYQDPQTVTLKDDKKRKDWAVVDLGRRTDVTGIRIRIDEIYQGSKFKYDVCISEIMFVKRTDSE